MTWGPGSRPSPVRHLDEDGYIFRLEKIRDERDKSSTGDGNDVPVDYETISDHQLQGEVCWCRAPREPSSGVLTQEDMKDFVTSQPAAVPCSLLSWVSCPTSALQTSGKRLKGTLKAAGRRPHQGDHARGLRAPCRGRGPSPDRCQSWGCLSARRGRGGDRGGEAGTWLSVGEEEGLASVPCVSREALSGERLGLLL